MTAPQSLESFGNPRQTPQQSSLSGSGRYFQLDWPAANEDRTLAPTVINWGCRAPANSGNFYSGGVGANGTFAYALNNGVPCIRYTAAAAASNLHLGSQDLWSLKTPTSRRVMPLGYDGRDCWRLVCNLAYGANSTPPVDTDQGVEMIYPSDGTNPYIIANAVGGFGVTRRPDGTASFIMRGGTGLNFIPIPIPGFDPTKFHSYEFRVVGPTSGSDAYLRLLCDGIVIKTLLWGVGTILPLYNNAAREAMFLLVSFGLNNAVMDIHSMSVMRAPTEAGLL